MDQCFRCEKDGKEVRLLDAIYENDMVKVCERCAVVESVPIIRKPSTSQLKEAERSYTVYQRLKKITGGEQKEKGSESILDQIRKLDENPELELPEKKPFNLVDNFHWEVTRARRNKGLSPRQLGWALGESETAIKMIEKAELPEEHEKLIRKLEQFFQIKLRERTEEEIIEENRKKEEKAKEKFKVPRAEKEPDFEEVPIKPVLDEEDIEETAEQDFVITELKEIEEEEDKSPVQILSFKPEIMDEITISDLKEIKEEKEKAERLAEAEEERKRAMHAANLLKETANEERRKKELREQIASEMKDIALGKPKPETIEEKRKMLDRAMKKVTKEEIPEKTPTLAELADRKSGASVSLGREKDRVPTISDLVEKRKEEKAEEMTGDEIEILEEHDS